MTLYTSMILKLLLNVPLKIIYILFYFLYIPPITLIDSRPTIEKGTINWTKTKSLKDLGSFLHKLSGVHTVAIAFHGISTFISLFMSTQRFSHHCFGLPAWTDCCYFNHIPL